MLLGASWATMLALPLQVFRGTGPILAPQVRKNHTVCSWQGNLGELLEATVTRGSLSCGPGASRPLSFVQCSQVMSDKGSFSPSKRRWLLEEVTKFWINSPPNPSKPGLGQASGLLGPVRHPGGNFTLQMFALGVTPTGGGFRPTGMFWRVNLGISG